MKEKITFIYNCGSYYTTKREVDWIEVSYSPDELRYSVTTKEGSIVCFKTYSIKRSELVAVVIHENKKADLPIRVHKLVKNAGVNVEVSHPWKDPDNPGTMYHVI